MDDLSVLSGWWFDPMEAASFSLPVPVDAIVHDACGERIATSRLGAEVSDVLVVIAEHRWTCPAYSGGVYVGLSTEEGHMTNKNEDKTCGDGDAKPGDDTRSGKHRDEGIPLGSRERFERIDKASPDGWESNR